MIGGDFLIIAKSKTLNQDLNWGFQNPSLPNNHCLITGISGSGKSCNILNLVQNMSKHNIPIVILDYNGGYRIDKLESDFMRNMSSCINIIDVYDCGSNINPFQLTECITTRDIAKKSMEITDLFSYALKFGPRQSTELYECILELHSHQLNIHNINFSNPYSKELSIKGISVALDMNALLYILFSRDSDASKRFISKLSYLSDFKVFSSESTLKWGNLLHNGTGLITIFQLDGYPESVKKVLAEIILMDMWQFTKKYGSKDKPFFLVLDECQHLNFKGTSPSTLILTEGRKYGYGACFATQSLNDTFDTAVINRLQQASLQMIFRPTFSEVHKLAKQIDISKSDRMEGVLNSLRKRECVIISQFENRDGSLTDVKTITAVIPDLGDFNIQ